MNTNLYVYVDFYGERRTSAFHYVTGITLGDDYLIVHEPGDESSMYPWDDVKSFVLRKSADVARTP